MPVKRKAVASSTGATLRPSKRLERRAEYLIHRDCRRKLLGKEPCAGRVGNPAKHGDAVSRGFLRQPHRDGADFALWPALLVDHDVTASLTPRASPQTKIGSVKAGRSNVITL